MHRLFDDNQIGLLLSCCKKYQLHSLITSICQINKNCKEVKNRMNAILFDKFYFEGDVFSLLKIIKTRKLLIHKNLINTICWTRYWYCESHKNIQIWFINNKIHRNNDLPAVIWGNGTNMWFQYGLRHRIGNPAVIYDGGFIYFEWDKFHRIDGPAVKSKFYKSGFGHFKWYYKNTLLKIIPKNVILDDDNYINYVKSRFLTPTICYTT